MELSEKILDAMQLKFSSDTILKHPRIISMRCNWMSAQTHYGNVLEHFRWDAIELWLVHNLELS